ncbi:MFS transporter [Haloechinothrix salitolerans]|uniref:MFS transporter n=1 Tax=Haloechinothrix salitolerans TaxID=926830 RepID=A0ABW2BUH7_9PSEU
MNTKAALYIGGLLGPFGGGVVAAMLPELGDSFDVSPALAASSLTTYLLPFALVMLVSGTLGERWGLSRSIRVAYLVYVLAALLSVVAPWFWLFQVSRGLQGVANAFTTPLLLTKLAAITPAHRLGRTVGTFGAMQAIGQTSAPLIGGLAAEASWRWAFAGIAVVALALTASPLPSDMPATPMSITATLRSTLRPVVRWPIGTALLLGTCLAGLPFLVAFRLDDAFALSPSLRGTVLTAYGVAGIIGARFVGGAADRFGARAAVSGGLLLGGLTLSGIALSDSLPLVTAAWAIAGLSTQLTLVGVNTTVLAGDGTTRSSAISVVTSARFLGMAAAPAAFTGLYRTDPALGFLLPAALLVFAIPAVVTGWPHRAATSAATR